MDVVRNALRTAPPCETRTRWTSAANPPGRACASAGSPCSARRRSATSERWQASGSRSTQNRAEHRAGGKLRGERVQVERVENLAGVALDVRGRERDPRALAHALAVVLAVLELAQLGGGRQFLDVAVADPRLRQRALESRRVGPGVLAAAHAAALPHVEQEASRPPRERVEERRAAEAVDADGGQAARHRDRPSVQRTASGASSTIAITRRLCTATMNVVFAPAPKPTASTA